jgi:hypothetical protein
MKQKDFLFWGFVIILFLPFFVSDSVFNAYSSFNREHGIIMSFFKFAILSTIGEMIGLRILTGEYSNKTFGIIPRMIVWGFLGMAICMTMKIFSAGTPVFLEFAGMDGATEFLKGELCWQKVLVALSISVAMNTIFAPVFMTFHKITDAHIAENNGSIKALISPIPMKRLLTTLNWDRQWNFVFAKTIPLFWYPAHTITFLLPTDLQVLFAALLGVMLGVLLALATPKK